MARPKPEPEDTPEPISVSFPRKVRLAGKRLVKAQPALKDFSNVVNVALRGYLEANAPGLIEEAAAEIRRGIYTQKIAPAVLAAEEEGPTEEKFREMKGQATKTLHAATPARRPRSRAKPSGTKS